MSLLSIFLVCAGLFAAAYLIYGRILARSFELNDANTTPAVEMNDGVDYVPAPAPVLLGQHFSAIAAAGPIVGPILAGLWFGWLPALLWIVIGAIFIGGVHDYAALVASIRHKARSIAEIVKENISPRAHKAFLLFIWISLMYVITAFTDLTATAFMEPRYGAGVAASSFMYLALAVAMGVLLYRFKVRLLWATLLFLPLLVLVIGYGQHLPIHVPAFIGGDPTKTWDLVILAYCFAASLIPFWVLLQPRGYLGSYFLYATFIAGFLGMFLSGAKVQYPAFLGFSGAMGMPLFPILFTTIACGACSGFHGIVSSGTTSKQLKKETHALAVGYTGMLLEGFVAVIALSTVMMLAPGDALTKRPPDEIYAHGLAGFLASFGIDPKLGVTFALLAFATFIYDTLDVATRLGRYIFQELTGLKGRFGAVAATFLTLLFPLAAVMTTARDVAGHPVPVWRQFWPVFGTSNQLLAALTLLGITVWLAKTGRSILYTFVPTVFMLVMTITSLILLIRPWIVDLFSGVVRFDMVGTIAVVLLALAIFLLAEAARAVLDRSKLPQPVPQEVAK